MSPHTKLWLTYSAIGLILSVGATILVNSYPEVRFISNEALVFGIMCASMGLAVKKASEA